MKGGRKGLGSFEFGMWNQSIADLKAKSPKAHGTKPTTSFRRRVGILKCEYEAGLLKLEFWDYFFR